MTKKQAKNPFKKYSFEIISSISRGEINSARELNAEKLSLAKKMRLHELPTNPDILALAKTKTTKLVSLLGVKPVRSLSGISVVAVMSAPHKCPGKCIYCPSGLQESTPKSYTGFEPATMRALNAKFDSFAQAHNRLQQLQQTGHNTEKTELIVMGGTFLSTPRAYQKKFMLGCLRAFCGKKAKTLATAKKLCEKARQRITGITFETRPDFCGKREINSMLDFGGTRVELGVQNIDDAIYKKINRGHTVDDVVNATALLKNSAFKIAYHFMPGLPCSSEEKDLKNFKRLFSDARFRPDMLKIYPCLVIRGTKLFDLWKKGDFEPLSTGRAAKLIARMKSFVPRYVRIMRVQRDIPSTVVSAGVQYTNLRQLVAKEMKKMHLNCNCIRCREAALQSHVSGKIPRLENATLIVEEYAASKGKEFFVSLEDKKADLLFGYCRLRLPFAPFRKELDAQTALVRELRVFSDVVGVGEKPLLAQLQHRGIGKTLLAEAEKIAREQLDARKLSVLSGIGVKEYYRKLGFFDDSAFVSKKL